LRRRAEASRRHIIIQPIDITMESWYKCYDNETVICFRHPEPYRSLSFAYYKGLLRLKINDICITTVSKHK